MPRFLFVTSRSAFPPTSGDRQRTHLILKAAASVGDVDTLLMSRSVTETDLQPWRETLGRVEVVVPRFRGEEAPWRWIRPVAPKWIDRAAHNLGRQSRAWAPDREVGGWIARQLGRVRYDAIIGRYLQPTARAGALRYVPVVLDVDDLDTEVYASRLRVPGMSGWRRAVIRHHLRQLERIVPDHLRRCAHVWLAKPADRAVVDHPSVSVLPNIPFPGGQTADVACEPVDAAKGVLFIGSFTHRVNHEGVDYFLRAVWPKVHGACPEARFQIAGSGLRDEKAAAWEKEPGVEIIGFVDDLRACYRQCAFAVVPLFEGGGSKIKVLETLAFARTVLVTDHALAGYEDRLHHGESVWVARNETELADGCLKLLNDPALRADMGRRGCDIVAASYSYERFQAIVAETFEGVSAAHPEGVRRR